MVDRCSSGEDGPYTTGDLAIKFSSKPAKGPRSCRDKIFQRKYAVLLAAVFSHAVGISSVFSFGVLFVELMESFGTTRSVTAWVASLAVGLTPGLGVLGGVFVNVLGYRVAAIAGGFLGFFGLFISFFATSILYLYFSVGICLGLSLSLVYTASTVSVGEYFGKDRAVALALMMVGQSIGSLVYPLFLKYLVEFYGWRGALLILGAVLMNLCVFGSLMKPLNSNGGSSRKLRESSPMAIIKSLLDLNVFQSTPYVLYLPARFLIGLGTALLYTIMVDFMMSKGFSKSAGTMMLVYFNVGNISGRLLAGLVQIGRKLSPLDVHIMSSLILASTYFIYQFAITFGHFLAVTVCSGLSLGLAMATYPAVPAQLVEPQFFPTAFALQASFHGLASMLSPPITAWLTDASGSYEYSLYVIGSCMLIGVALCVGIRVILWRQRIDDVNSHTV